jgi:hypothetical protein
MNVDVSTSLVRYDAMCRAIDDAYKIDEVKDIHDRVAAFEHYSRQARNVEAERRCCEIRLRAERKAGQLLAQMEKAKGGRPSDKTPAAAEGVSTLRDLGITEKQSSQWQKLAAVSSEEFEAALATPDKPTTAGIIDAAFPPKPTPVSSQALWLWGRLRDFSRDGLLDRNPSDVLSSMTTEMLADVMELAPRVAQWLILIEPDSGASSKPTNVEINNGQYSWPCIPDHLKEARVTKEQDKILRWIPRHFTNRRSQRILVTVLQELWPWMPR